MLKIRLQRVGRVHEPYFRLVLTDSENSTKSGRFKEILGNYDAKKGNIELKSDLIKNWINKGAKLSDTVHNMLIEKKIITGKKINKLPKKTVEKEVVTEDAQTSNTTEDVKSVEANPQEPQA